MAIAVEILGCCGAVHKINVIYDFSTPYSLYTVMLSDSGSHPGGMDHPAVHTTRRGLLCQFILHKLITRILFIQQVTMMNLFRFVEKGI